MKNLTLLVLSLFCSSFLISQAPTGLEKIIENGNSGWRLIGQSSSNYGDIGLNAVDLSISTMSSSSHGATGNYSLAGGINTTAAAGGSISIGENTIATGLWSISMGLSSEASGPLSLAIGNNNSASGSGSVSLGVTSIASGVASTALGGGTRARGRGTTAIGLNNTVDFNANPSGFSPTNRAFVIGNGTSDTTRSDALIVLFDGTTTISGHVSATSFTGDGSGLTSVPGNGLEPITEFSNTGWRLAGQDPDFYGVIGDYAIDLSISSTSGQFLGATGLYSVALGFETEASEELSTAMGYQSTASGLVSTAMGNLTVALGDVSTAMGAFTIASGEASSAFGISTTASGDNSTALGVGTNASGRSSTAMGNQTIAAGQRSTAMGSHTKAAGYGTTVIGTFNTIHGGANPTYFLSTNRAFVIGNGTEESTRSDALSILFDGTTTIAGPVSAPSFTGDGSGLINVPGDGLEQTTEFGIPGWRLAGQDPLNYGNIGFNAIDLSISTTASNSFGATGVFSAAIGLHAKALGNFSVAIGQVTSAIGHSSTSLGTSTTAIGDFSTALGFNSSATGTYSSAFGNSTIATGFGTTAIGIHNTIDSSANPGIFDPGNRALVIGNGTSDSTKSDALTILFDGTTTIAGDLTVNSDQRLKNDIRPLGSTLSKLQLLEGKTYKMIHNSSRNKIGLLAQDVQKVFPQLVRKANDQNGTLSINYQGMIPVLINAINEQHGIINNQQLQLEQNQKQIDQLVEIVTKLMEQK